MRNMTTARSKTPLLISVDKVWDAGEHNAFTDLIYYKNRFLLAFREGNSHQQENGIIRILESLDGHGWKPKSIIEEEGLDLRDPKFSILPDGRLHLLMGGSRLDKEGNILSINTFVTDSSDDIDFKPLTQILDRNEWLWRLTWQHGVGYGVAYCRFEEETYLTLYQTRNGYEYEKLFDFDIDRWPSESTIRFDESGRMNILVRRDENWNTHALLGISAPPFDEWEWYDTGYAIGGPNFIPFPNNELWVTGRVLYGSPYGIFAKTALLLKESSHFHRKLLLPSFGDTSYPGMVLQGGFLWMSYYSSHEDNAAIYIAKILLP